MDLKPALRKLEQEQGFIKWRSKNKEAYFSYAFKIPEEMGADEWQMGFYDKKKDTITTFVMAGDKVSIRPKEEVFKKEETKVNRIELDNVSITFDSAMSKANDFQQKNFPKDRSMKTIAILQNISGLGNIATARYERSEYIPKGDPSVSENISLGRFERSENIWNITFITEAFNTLNIKIDALNGEVIEHNLSSVFAFRE